MAKPPRDYGWVGDEPSRTCARCGGAIVLKGNSVWFRRFPVIETFHMDCDDEPNHFEGNLAANIAGGRL